MKDNNLVLQENPMTMMVTVSKHKTVHRAGSILYGKGSRMYKGEFVFQQFSMKKILTKGGGGLERHHEPPLDPPLI